MAKSANASDSVEAATLRILDVLYEAGRTDQRSLLAALFPAAQTVRIPSSPAAWMTSAHGMLGRYGPEPRLITRRRRSASGKR